MSNSCDHIVGVEWIVKPESIIGRTVDDEENPVLIVSESNREGRLKGKYDDLFEFCPLCGEHIHPEYYH